MAVEVEETILRLEQEVQKIPRLQRIHDENKIRRSRNLRWSTFQEGLSRGTKGAMGKLRQTKGSP